MLTSAKVYFVKLHMGVYLHAKFPDSCVILTSFRQGANFTLPPPQNEPLKSPSRLRLKNSTPYFKLTNPNLISSDVSEDQVLLCLPLVCTVLKTSYQLLTKSYFLKNFSKKHFSKNKKRVVNCIASINPIYNTVITDDFFSSPRKPLLLFLLRNCNMMYNLDFEIAGLKIQNSISKPLMDFSHEISILTIFSMYTKLLYDSRL